MNRVGWRRRQPSSAWTPPPGRVHHLHPCRPAARPWRQVAGEAGDPPRLVVRSGGCITSTPFVRSTMTVAAKSTARRRAGAAEIAGRGCPGAPGGGGVGEGAKGESAEKHRQRVELVLPALALGAKWSAPEIRRAPPQPASPTPARRACDSAAATASAASRPQSDQPKRYPAERRLPDTQGVPARAAVQRQHVIAERWRRTARGRPATPSQPNDQRGRDEARGEHGPGRSGERTPRHAPHAGERRRAAARSSAARRLHGHADRRARARPTRAGRARRPARSSGPRRTRPRAGRRAQQEVALPGAPGAAG